VRVATWNCCSAGASKVSYLEKAGVDVAVMCEAPLANPRASETLIDRRLSWLSAGTIPSKGLALVGITRSLAATVDASGAGRWTLMADVAGGPSILGIWSCPAASGGPAYGAEVIRALDANAERIAGGDVIVAGDFNVGQGMAERPSKDWATPVREGWENLGLVSAYHMYFGEPFGVATQATYFHQRHSHQGFHIDYVLVHRTRIDRVKNVTVGSFDEWVGTGRSDHVPIFVDLDW
jgi:hypothetical protein